MRSIWIVSLLACAATLCFLGGANKIGQLKKPEVSGVPLVEGIHPERDYPVTEKKSFTIVLYAHNAVDWCERSLRSVFEQDYEKYRVVFVDDASNDGTWEKMQQFIVQNQQDYRVIAIRNESVLGPVGSLYRAAEHCQDAEILVPLNAQNWLAHDNVLSRLNQTFQNPDVWVSLGQSIEYPAYHISDLPVFNPKTVAKSGFEFVRGCTPFCAFYASVFKSIAMARLWVDGRFSQLAELYVTNVLELAGGRMRLIHEPLTFANSSVYQSAQTVFAHEQSLLKSRAPNQPCVRFPVAAPEKKGVDIVIFSFDRPMQLFCTLESVERYLSGYQTLTVLYRVSDHRFDDAYNAVKAVFPNVHYLKQSDHPHGDFKPLLVQAVSGSPSEYIMFGVDDIVVKDFVDLNFCRRQMEKTGAYGFFLRFGRHIQQSYMVKKPQAVPVSVPLNNGVLAWDFCKGECDWGFPNNVDMTVYRKADINKWLTELDYKNPNLFECRWAKHPPANTIGLYFEYSKMVNVPLNVVHSSGCPHMNFMTAEELLVKFNQGYKINIDPFFQVNNPSPHCDYVPEFILR